MNNRRKVIVAFGAGALTASFGSFAQQPTTKMHRIGFLGPTSAAGIASRLEALRIGLRELGYVEGKNLVIEFRWAESNYERLPELAAELVRLNVDLIVTHATQAALAAKRATTTIPIVIMAVGDAVAAGVVASLARPGGNITGLSFFIAELNVKRLELLKEAYPRANRVAVLAHPNHSVLASSVLPAMELAAKSLKIVLKRFDVRGPLDFENAFVAMAKQRIDAVVIFEDTMLVANAGAVANLAAKHRVPSIGFIEIGDAGGLMAYGVDLPAMSRRSAVFVDKILKGTKPTDLPIERATVFESVLNMKAAKALGIKIPNSILVQATKVIE
jgi:putative ABC transport system substrate-binding protein